ncbi:MAG TPA: SelT/SelW/SelH family protein [Geminicoccaceae bacterium]|nr:SelT/SelW/SelH family protein [Geminicoccus sp.]HMU50880.1 SelT/SelW/SelH family protein [Geminicoccaceae bacterium]
MTAKPRIVITYCRQCGWLLRAAWMAQELLSTFAEDLGEVALVPGTGGIFAIDCNGEPIWDRKRDGGFPDVRTLKQRVRDRVDPERGLGHVDRAADRAQD